MPGGWVDPAAVPDTLRFVHDALAIGDDLQVPSEHLQGNGDGVELGAVHGLDRAGQGPGCRVRPVVSRPEGARRPPKIGVPGAHRRSVGVDEVRPRELALRWPAAIHFCRGSGGAIVGGWSRHEPTFPQAPWLPVRGLPQKGQLSAFRAPEDIPPRAYPPPVQRGLPGVLAQGAARVDVETRPGVAVPGPGSPGEDTRVLPEGGVLFRVKGLPGPPEGSLLIYAVFGPSEVAPPEREREREREREGERERPTLEIERLRESARD